MKEPRRSRTGIVLGIVAFAAASGAAFAAWADQGTAIFASLVETGMAWCF